jgi:anaphase-promoting complex subunit 1
MKKKWNFEEEGQSVQWACIGWLEHYMPAGASPSPSAAHYTTRSSASLRTSDERSTFGPFAQAQQTTQPDLRTPTKISAVFVFLRSIGKIFLKNGLEYTFALPFIVRKAWPLWPHGVMIQRVLEPTELEEAEMTGDSVLPTIFSVTSPFSEAGTVGLTSGIVGGFRDTVPLLRDEDENLTRPLKSIPPTEMVVWVSHRGGASDDDVLVTVDVEKHQVCVWRYAYLKPKDTPVPLSQTGSVARKRQSLIGVGSRRSSAIFGDSRHPLSPRIRDRDHSPTPDFLAFPELPPLSSLPGMPPTLTTTNPMGSLGLGGMSQSSGTSRGRRNSLTRNDLSVTMDRMVLGGRFEGDPSATPIEHGRMKAAYWMEKIYSQDIDITEYVLQCHD